jgi:5-oxoprolinase (ATP-hydrolysing) subunit A
MRSIDLNCDMGEMPDALANGTQEELMRHISSVNIACGGHAGNAQLMRATIEQALRHGVSIGAHPGYEDPANFGRKQLHLVPEEISASVYRQTVALEAVALKSGAAISHVKVHGALYNEAACNREIARAISEGVRRWKASTILVGLASSAMLEEFQAAGFQVASEAFADRRYEKDGTLRSRKFEDSLLHDPEEAAAQALRIVEQGTVVAADRSVIPLIAQTICIHSDTPGAVQIASAVHRRLTQSGITIRAFNANS